ncbi:hypothetical protein JMJ76_0006269 [Colletotrichum scovillei]|nr:hypothetical protein JMJ76_0006269 [Colletotrichum scovillei]
MGNLVYMARRDNKKQSLRKKGPQSDNIPTKTICVMRRDDGDKKFIRKVKEQLRDLEREDRIEVIKRPDLNFEIKDGKVDFRLKKDELEIGSSSHTFDEESPYDSDKPRNVA